MIDHSFLLPETYSREKWIMFWKSLCSYSNYPPTWIKWRSLETQWDERVCVGVVRIDSLDCYHSSESGLPYVVSLMKNYYWYSFVLQCGGAHRNVQLNLQIIDNLISSETLDYAQSSDCSRPFQELLSVDQSSLGNDISSHDRMIFFFIKCSPWSFFLLVFRLEIDQRLVIIMLRHTRLR